MAGKGMAPLKASSDKRRPNATPGFRQLPWDGRQGDPPQWPLSDSSPREVALWKKLWTLPQATMWEQMRCEDTVALYTRAYLVVADDITDDKMLNQVRQLDSKLGLSPRALQDLRWEIESAPVDATPSSNGSTAERVFVPKDPS